MTDNNQNRPVLQPSTVGELIKLNTCQRYFKFRINNAGLDQLDHDRSEYSEAFRGGNIVEKREGEIFERQVVNKIRNNVTDFYDLTQTTLKMVSQACSDVYQTFVKYNLTDALSYKDIQDVGKGEYKIYGINADSVFLHQPEKLKEQCESNESYKEDAIEGAFFELRIKYTKELFNGILDQKNHAPIYDKDLQFTTPSEPENTYSESSAVKDSSDESVNHAEQLNRQHDNPIVVFQPTFEVEIGTWKFAGDADIIFIWNNDSTTHIRVVDIKLATEEQINHQIQATIYATALQRFTKVHNSVDTLDGGIYTRNDGCVPPIPENIPSFTIESRKSDLQRLASQNGIFDTAHKTPFNESSYQLDEKCTSCQYNEVCYTESIENNRLELLGIPQGTKQIFVRNGINDLNDLADLAHSVDKDVHPKKDSKPSPVRVHRDTYNELATLPEIGDSLPALIQRAQTYLSVLNPSHQRALRTDDAVHITNSGYGKIPSDDWNESWDKYSNHKSGSMIRVYLNVQHDHIRDTIVGLGFHAVATAAETSEFTHAVVADDVYNDQSKIHTEEVSMIEDFIDKLFTALTKIEYEINLDNVPQDNPFLHFYIYTEAERQALEKRIARYDSTDKQAKKKREIQSQLSAFTASDESDVEWNDNSAIDQQYPSSYLVNALRSLLSKARRKNDRVISVVAPDIQQRMATQTPTSGLINIYDRLFPPKRDSEERFKHNDWTYTRNKDNSLHDGSKKIDLTDIFDHRFFNNSAPYKQKNNHIELLLDYNKDSDVDPDGWYNYRVREGAQIPLAYIWSALGKVDESWAEKLKESNPRVKVNPFIYHDRERKQNRIQSRDVKELIKRMCECLRHVEQGIPIKNRLTPSA